MKCKESASQEFNYKNMEQELLHTVWEEETIPGISGKSMLYGQQTELQTATGMKDQKGMRTIREQNQFGEINEPEESDYDDEIHQKQPGKLALAVLAGAAVFGGLAFFLQSFSTDYVYEKKEAEYLNCLKMMSEEDYSGALGSIDLLLKDESDSLAYLGLKNTI